DEDPALTCSIYRPRPYEWDNGGPAHPDAQLAAFKEITDQLFEHAYAALKDRDDHWKVFRIIARAERLLGIYTSENFDHLLPIHRELQNTLHLAFRIVRRAFIRRALTCPEDQRAAYDEYIRSGKLEGPDAVADYEAVEKHLDEGRALYDDLHRRSKIKLVG